MRKKRNNDYNFGDTFDPREKDSQKEICIKKRAKNVILDLKRGKFILI